MVCSCLRVNASRIGRPDLNFIREHKVAAIPGTAFGLDKGCYIRLAYGSLAPDTAVTALDRFVAGVRSILKH